jgi:hypothetical protein
MPTSPPEHRCIQLAAGGDSCADVIPARAELAIDLAGALLGRTEPP